MVSNTPNLIVRNLEMIFDSQHTSCQFRQPEVAYRRDQKTRHGNIYIYIYNRTRHPDDFNVTLLKN
jgi:hypothetical protein